MSSVTKHSEHSINTYNLFFSQYRIPQLSKKVSNRIDETTTLLKRLVFPELKERICFIHIPKCGGTSIRRAISNVYKPWTLKKGTHIISPREMAMREAEQLAGSRKGFVRTDLLNYHLALPSTKCLMGHYRFSRETIERYKNEWNFMTVIRDPVDRWYSHYFYNKNTNSIFNIDMELHEFVETELALSMGSEYVSVITGEREIKKLRSQRYIKETINILREFAVVGNLENLDKFYNDFKKKFGASLSIPHLNITSNNKRKGWEHIPDTIHQKVLEFCQPDIEIYRSIIEK
jgi:hypothetical protein